MRLTSWKEIAAYLGRDVRTVLRWHKERGLPVHRAPGARKGSVFAYQAELDEWLRSGQRPAPPEPTVATPPPRVSYRFIAAALLLSAAAVSAALVALRPPAVIHDIVIDAGSVIARDASGAAIWSHPFDGVEATLSAKRAFALADLDGDGSREAVIAIRHKRASDRKPEETLLCVDARGRVRWRRVLSDEIDMDGTRFGPPWRAEDVVALDTPQGTRVAVAVHHDVWDPSFVAFLDADGRVLDRFVNTGWITRIEPSAGGLIAAGFDNRRDAAVLLMLREGALSGPAVRGVSLPRTEINRAIGHAPVEDHLVVHGDGTIVLRVPQHHVATDIEAVYELAPDFTVRRAKVSDVYWTAHRRLEAEGRIAHAADTCPERHGLPVRAYQYNQ